MNELKLDLDEVKRIESLSSRPRLLNHIKALRLEIEKEIEALSDKKNEDTPATKTEPQKPKIFTNTITSYGWDQSEKFVKIYVSNLKGVNELPKENVTVSYVDGHYKLFIANLNGKNYQLTVPKLYKNVVSASVKPKSDMVVIMLKKETAENWETLSQKDKIEKEKKNDKFKSPAMDDKDADPSKGIMDLMKKMYDEGDDDMKRTIAKAWTESRDKQQGNMM